MWLVCLSVESDFPLFSGRKMSTQNCVIRAQPESTRGQRGLSQRDQDQTSVSVPENQSTVVTADMGKCLLWPHARARFLDCNQTLEAWEGLDWDLVSQAACWVDEGTRGSFIPVLYIFLCWSQELKSWIPFLPWCLWFKRVTFTWKVRSREPGKKGDCTVPSSVKLSCDGKNGKDGLEEQLTPGGGTGSATLG